MTVKVYAIEYLCTFTVQTNWFKCTACRAPSCTTRHHRADHLSAEQEDSQVKVRVGVPGLNHEEAAASDLATEVSGSFV